MNTAPKLSEAIETLRKYRNNGSVRIWDMDAALDVVLAALAPPSGEGVDGELARIGELIRTQDNRITDQPMFIVQQKREYAAHPDYDHDRIAWVDGDGEANEEEAATLEAQYKATHQEPAGWTRAAVGYYWDFVTACFTEQGCKDYIARDGHNLKEPRIYAAGSYRNAEWRTVRNYLAGFTAPQSAPVDGDALFAKCYALLSKAVSAAGFNINTKNGEMYLTPKTPPPASQERVEKEVADNLIAALIDISECGIENGEREWADAGHKACAMMAYEAIRENEWFWGGRDKPAASPPSSAPPSYCPHCGQRDDGVLACCERFMEPPSSAAEHRLEMFTKSPGLHEDGCPLSGTPNLYASCDCGLGAAEQAKPDGDDK